MSGVVTLPRDTARELLTVVVACTLGEQRQRLTKTLADQLTTVKDSNERREEGSDQH